MSTIQRDKKGEGVCPNGTCNMERDIVLQKGKLRCWICKREYNKDTWADVRWTEEGYTPPIEYL